MATQSPSHAHNRHPMAHPTGKPWSVVITLILAAGLGAMASLGFGQEIVMNGGFSSGTLGLQSWTQMPPTTYGSAINPLDGTNALRVSSRPGTTFTLRQNITTSILNAGQGTTHSLRFQIACDGPAQVRGSITYLETGTSTARTVIFAETMARQPGAWQEVRGTWPVSWLGTLNQAFLTFEIGNALEPVGAAPAFNLDNVSLQPDPDGDTLTASEEATSGTSPLLADTDADSVPDNIELRLGLNPAMADGLSADADSDGATNIVEAWAGTDPLSALSRPGVPCTVGASASVAQIARILAELPGRGGDNRVAVGQHISFPAAPELEYQVYVQPLATNLGDLPAVLALQYENVVTTPVLYTPTVNPLAYAHWQAGGIVEIKFNPSNPWTGSSPNSSNHGPVNLAELVTTGTAPNIRFLEELGRVADGLEELQTSGVPILYRTCAEQNAPHFWWGRRPRSEFIAFWNMMHDFLTRQRGLKNLLFVFEADANPHSITAIDYYYPGSETVDVLGHNFYNDTYDPGFDAQGLLWKYGKIYAIPQAGPVPKPNGVWDNRYFLVGSSGTAGIKNRFSRLSYFVAWNSWSDGMGNAYRMAIVDHAHGLALWQDPWILTLNDARVLLMPTAAVQHWRNYGLE